MGPGSRSYKPGADLDPDEIAAAQLSVDHQIESR